MRIITIAIFLLGVFGLSGQNGILKESLKMDSEILGKEVAYSVYLPFDYESSNRSYPILYLLHGYSDDETGWVQYGHSNYIADQSIASGEAPPMIIVTPDAGVSWYVNSFDGNLRWEDFFMNEFMPAIEKKFRVRPGSQFRAVAGLSMGGHGSLILALKHPDKFSACAPLSAAIWTDEGILAMAENRWDSTLGQPYGKGLEGEDRVSEHYRKNSVLYIIENTDPEELGKVDYYIDCGDDDELVLGNMALHALMIAKGIPHEFRVRDGGHTWTYWRSALPEVLKFIGKRFHR